MTPPHALHLGSGRAGQHAATPAAAPLPARPAPPAAPRPAPRQHPAPGPPATSPPPGRRHASTDLDPAPQSAARARHLTRDTLTRWGLHALTNDAETIATELTANAIAAATPPHGTRPAIIFTLHHQPPDLHITTWDNGPGHPAPATPADDAETGRGLAIIDALTTSNWGWWPTPESGGKVTWATLTTTHATPTPQGRATTLTTTCLCGFTELADETFADHVLAVFTPEDSRGADGRVHDEAKPLTCCCGFPATSPEELDLHFFHMFVPLNTTGTDGKKHGATQ
jgi:anti-sigma regulatory factor (Ser/Thr protein kinase)